MSEELQYVRHASGIHEFTFLKASRNSIDELYEVMRGLLQHHPKPDSVLLLVDVTNGIYPPLRYLFSATTDFNATHDDAPPGYTAVISNPNAVVMLADTFMKTLSQFIVGYNNLRFFKPDEREQAIQWLLHLQQEHSEP